MNDELPAVCAHLAPILAHELTEGNEIQKVAIDAFERCNDLRGGVRGKYFADYQKGTNLILLAPDVAKSFLDSEAVNEALRKVISEKRVAQKRAIDARANSACSRRSPHQRRRQCVTISRAGCAAEAQVRQTDE
jgi:hypothetical protein